MRHHSDGDLALPRSTLSGGQMVQRGLKIAFECPMASTNVRVIKWWAILQQTDILLEERAKLEILGVARVRWADGCRNGFNGFGYMGKNEGPTGRYSMAEVSEPTLYGRHLLQLGLSNTVNGTSKRAQGFLTYLQCCGGRLSCYLWTVRIVPDIGGTAAGVVLCGTCQSVSR